MPSKGTIMFYLIFDFLLVACGAAGGYFVARRGNRKDSLDRTERAELDSLSDLRDNLIHLSLNNLESDPFAQIVLDEIRKSGRKELS